MEKYKFMRLTILMIIFKETKLIFVKNRLIIYRLIIVSLSLLVLLYK